MRPSTRLLPDGRDPDMGAIMIVPNVIALNKWVTRYAPYSIHSAKVEAYG